MASSGADSFVEGLQGGMKFRQDSRRNKRIDKALDYRLAEMGRSEQGMLKDRASEGLDNTGVSVADDPMAEKLGWFGKWKQGIKEDYGDSPMGKLFSGGEQKQQALNTEVTQIQEAIPAPVQGMGQPEPEMPDAMMPGRGGMMRPMADGGRVHRQYTDEERMQRSYGENYLTEEEANEMVVKPGAGMSGARTRRGVAGPQAVPTSGGGLRGFAGDVKRQFTDDDSLIQDVGRNTLPNTRRRVRDWVPAGMDADRAVLDAETAGERGLAIRENMVEGGRGIGQLATGLYEDSGADSLIKGVGGFLFGESGGGDDKAAAIEASDVAAQPTQQAPDSTGQPSASAAGTGGATPVGEGAAAIPTEQEKPYVFDPTDVQDPGEIPRMSTRDWEEYRRAKVDALTLQGMSAMDAHQRITQMQMEGFTNHAMQAWQLLGAGDWRSASASLTAAYQYFPNGADVKFGMHQDKQGQPALVAMGTGEKDGKPVGNPMLLNQERLATMIEQMSNPAAFTSWTKDWRAEKMQREIYEGYTKPIGEANAETDRINARSRERESHTSAINAGSRGGLKQTDIDRGLAAIEDILGESWATGKVPDDHMNRLGLLAGLLYENDPGNATATIRGLLETYDMGGMQAVETELGISEAP